MWTRLGFLLASLALGAACGNDEAFPTDATPTTADAPGGSTDARFADAYTGPDGAPNICLTPADTADILTSGSGPNESYDRLYAGGIYNTGPVAPPLVAGEPTFDVDIVFSNESPIDAFDDCTPDTDCAIVSLRGRIGESITPANAVGDHPIALRKSDDVAFTIDGTITIDAYESPYADGIGSMSGSVSGTTGGRTVSGTFDGVFCGAMISFTI